MQTSLILRTFILVLVLSAISPYGVYAHRFGITGVFAAGCGNCHGAQAGATTTTLEGPRSVRGGQSAAYTFVVGNGNPNNQWAGLNLSFRQGAGNAGTITAGNGSKVDGGELTHNGAPLAMNANAARFAFTWLAPAAHGVYSFNGAGNAVNNDLNSTNEDNWNATGNINITVTGATFTVPPAGTTICRGSALQLNWTQTGLTTVRLEWSRDNFANTEVIGTSVDATALALTYNVPGTQTPGIYVVRMVDIASGAELGRTNFITIVGSPVINLQPLATFVCEGKPLNITVSASGNGLLYRWRRNGTDIPGGVNAVLTINTVGQAEAGQYDCVIFGCGGSSTSDAVAVTIGTKPRIIAQPTSRTVCDGDSVSFGIETTGSDLILQWLKNGEPVPGQITKKITFPRSTLFDEGDYTCIVQGSCTPEVESAIAKLNVVEMPIVRIEPTDRNLKSGDSLTLTFDAAGELVTYQWFKNGILIVGATQRVYRKTGVTRADSGVYTCNIMNQCDTAITRGAIVKITASAGPGQLELTSTTLMFIDVASCSTIDTLMMGLLVNEGGSPITITSISAEPIANISVEGVTAPLTLAPNERRDVRFKITPKKSGPLSATASFFASSGNRTFNITGTAITGLSFEKDTLIFAQGVVADRRCNVSIPLPCAATSVTRIRITGPGATTWGGVTPVAPLLINSGNTIDLCLETTADAGENAIVSIETDAGDVSFVVTRGIISGVEEDDAVATRIRFVPNPMTDELRITSPFTGEMRARIVTVTGATIALLSGTNEIVWNRRDANGSNVPTGLYVVFIEQGAVRRFEKIIVR